VTELLAGIDAAKADLGRLENEDAGEVRLGVFPGLPARILAQTLIRLGRRNSGVRITATEEATDAALLDRVRSGDLELAFAHLPPETGPFATCQLLQMPWVLLVRADTELAKRGTAPTAAELVRIPLLTAECPRFRPDVDALRGEFGSVRVVFRSDVAPTLQALAAAGVGAAVMPQFAVEERDPGITMMHLGEMFPPLDFGLVWHRDRRLSAAALQFRGLVQSVCSAVSGRNSRFAREEASER
jgi:LysR family hydrogen peroxide-inducible transcriptional activator